MTDQEIVRSLHTAMEELEHIDENTSLDHPKMKKALQEALTTLTDIEHYYGHKGLDL